MARFAIGTVPSTGHVTPLLPIARALAAQGHDVRWTSGAKHRARISATGARFVPYRHAREIDESRLDEVFPGREKLRGLASIKYDLKHVFLDPALDQLRDLEDMYRDEPFDALIADVAYLGAQFYHQRTQAPLAVVSVSALFVSSRDVAPIGLALFPSATPSGRLRNRGLEWAIQNVVMRDVRDHYDKLRKRAGLTGAHWFIDCHESASIVLQPTIPSFEYPRSDLPHNVHFIGLLPSDPPSELGLPSWWEELDGKRPVVHVTQGTVANVTPDLIAPTLAGLAREDALVVATTGGRAVHELGLGALPGNARVATFIPHDLLLPKARVMVTNGGYGGVQLALKHGVPLVVAGASEEKPEIAARVAYSGAGLRLRTSRPTARQVRTAVRTVLDDRVMQRRVSELAAEYARFDALALALQHIDAMLRGVAQPGEARTSQARGAQEDTSGRAPRAAD